jgi:tetratricopeptide (TPR) repeat protein
MANRIGESGYRPSYAQVGEWKQPGELPFWRAVLVLILGAGILVMLYADLSGPMNKKLASRNLVRGDLAVAAERYDEAAKEYSLAIERDPSLQIAADRAALVEVAKTDPLAARSLFEVLGASSQLAKLDRVTRDFINAPDALVTGVAMLKDGEKVYARYALKKALELDPNYIEAKDWLKQAEE